jgi:hypothetical protein
MGKRDRKIEEIKNKFPLYPQSSGGEASLKIASLIINSKITRRTVFGDSV